ncbi:MAG: Txe/YoeB family addiction module toxin [Saprospiraceae bacterium]|nr:Txe/YoeB family addiction module toxin [Saprospiraceae bacterium]
MEIAYTQQALSDIKYWKEMNNKAILIKITNLLLSIEQDPFKGIGKPEPLKHKYAGLWSRRLNKEHRLIYQIFDSHVLILSLKDHY